MDLSVLLPIAQAAEPTDGLKAVALGVGAGLGTIGPGIGVGYIFGKVIESVTRQPEMREEITSIQWLGFAVPAFALYAATANLSIPLVLTLVVWGGYQIEGVRRHGLIGHLKGWLPAGVSGVAAVPIFFIEVISQFMRIISLSVRLFANILAGHLLILFMAGGLAVLLGIEALGVVIIPFGIAIFLFEVGLVATLQAFIFATLSAIYLGGAVAEHH